MYLIKIIFFILFSFLTASEVDVNYYDAFVKVVKYNENSYIKGFQELKENNISVIRINGSGFYFAKDWKFYINHKKEYFKLLDEFINNAEKYDIKIIFDFFWRYSAIANLEKESIQQAYGNTESKSFRFMKTYIQEVVNRYKNSKAILMWEIGNEYNLKINLPCKRVKKFIKKCKKDDVFTYNTYDNLMENLIAFIKKLDNKHMVSTGNSIPRIYVYKKKINNENYKKILKEIIMKENKYSDVISLHLYPWTLKKRVFMKYFKDFSDFISFVKSISLKYKKHLLIGEFGFCKIKDFYERKEKFFEYMLAFKKNKIDYTLIWVFDRKKDKICNVNLKELVYLRKFLYE